MIKNSKNDFNEAQLFDDVKQIIYNSVKLYPDNVAFVIKQKQDNDDKNIEYKNITYKMLLDDINSFGTALYSIGMSKKRIAIFGKNRYEWVVAHIANLLGGIISVPLDKELQFDELQNSLIRSQADAIVFDEKYIDLIEKIKQSGKTNIKEYICMSKNDEYKDINSMINLGKGLISNGDNSFIENKIDPDAMSILLFTSGTTSKAKAVMLSQRGIAINVYDMQLVESFYKNDVNIAFLPFHHIFGSTCIIVMLACGVKTVFYDGLKYIKKNMQEYGVTLFVAVPILLEKMYQGIEKQIKKEGKYFAFKCGIVLSRIMMVFGIDIRRKLFKQVIDGFGGSIRFIISGGAALNPNISDKFNGFGIHTVQGYGLTETSPVIAAENDKYLRHSSVGFPMKHDDIQIIDKDKDGIGQIIIKGPNVMLGYYQDPERTKEVLKDGYFYTGDLGYFDKDGFLYVTGRKKDMIVLKNGKKVFPEELESLVNKINGVKESFVFAMPKENKDEDYILSVKIVYDVDKIKKDYPNVEKDKLYDIMWQEVKKLNLKLPNYKHIKKVIITDKELIKTSTQKIKRQEEIKTIVNEKK